MYFDQQATWIKSHSHLACLAWTCEFQSSVTFLNGKDTTMLTTRVKVIIPIGQIFNFNLKLHVAWIVFICCVTIAGDAFPGWSQSHPLLTKHCIGMHIIRNSATAMGVHDLGYTRNIEIAATDFCMVGFKSNSATVATVKNNGHCSNSLGRVLIRIGILHEADIRGVIKLKNDVVFNQISNAQEPGCFSIHAIGVPIRHGSSGTVQLFDHFNV